MITAKLMVPIAALAAAAVSVPVVERALPVVAFMRAVEVSRDGERVVAHVIGRKLRDCAYIGGSQIGWAKSGGVWREVGFQFLEDDTPDSTRPADIEKQDFGLWEWSRVPAGATEVRLTVMHDCDGVVTLTPNGPFSLGD